MSQKSQMHFEGHWQKSQQVECFVSFNTCRMSQTASSSAGSCKQKATYTVVDAKEVFGEIIVRVVSTGGWNAKSLEKDQRMWKYGTFTSHIFSMYFIPNLI